MKNVNLFALSMLLTTITPLSAACAEQPDRTTRPNILFIAVDDLKPLSGSYGDNKVITPSIDALARESTVFTHAYVQYPVCGPSRASLLTGLRPEANGVLDLKTRLRDVHPDIITLPQFFRNAGYETAATGKIFDPRNVDSRKDDDPASWSIPYKSVSGKADEKSEPNYVAKAVEARNDRFTDGLINQRGQQLLRRMAAGNKPFFLGVGFKKPHLPFVAPKRFFDLYDRADFDLAAFQSAPADSDSSYVLNDNNELRTYWPTPEAGAKPAPYGESITPAQQRELLHGYYAAVSFVDSLVGELLQTLADTGAMDNTIIVLWGDHGFHLGDHGLWGKHTTMEQAARHPLIIRVPGVNGGQTRALAEAMDLYPTLLELTGFEAPVELQGASLVPVLRDKSAAVNDVAITQYKRKGAYGYSMRTERYRYTEWVRPNGEVAYRDLYDLQVDPGEQVNIGDRDENAALMTQLANMLRDNGEGLLRLKPL